MEVHLHTKRAKAGSTKLKEFIYESTVLVAKVARSTGKVGAVWDAINKYC